ncbi:hypothetical protein BGZ76_004749 [Entomortierella beljakovae]|nr:hypothetical protein BGZ76_004749 [Entomortierella beljakovae]
MTMKNKPETKGKKKDNLGWEIIKLQAQVGETNSRKAKKAVEAAEKKKEGVSTSTGLDSSESTAVEDAAEKALSEANEKLLKLKEQKISQKIYQAKKEIRKTFVKAKGLETQRLIKRLKEARKSIEKSNETESTEKTEEETKPKKKHEFTPEDVAKFENELELVKKIDMDSVSEHAFNSKLAKHPILGSHAIMEPYVKPPNKKSGESTEKDSLIQAIESRLTNTKVVKDQLTKLLDEMEHIINGKKADSQDSKNKRKTRADNEEPESKKLKTRDTKRAKMEDNEESDIGDDEDEESDSNEDVDMSEVSGDEHDDGYDSDGLPITNNNKRATAVSSMFIGSLNEENSKKDRKNKDKKGKKDKNDWVDDKFDEIYGKIKKNRPGQRARRAKAELKFGKEANHVKKAEEEARLRAEKKAARKAKMEKYNASAANSQKMPNRRIVGAGDGSASIPQSASSKPSKVNDSATGPNLNDPTLHPSWIAKQTEKAAMAAALSGSKSNKIVFDDSD